jgi:hypothetical protein
MRASSRTKFLPLSLSVTGLYAPDRTSHRQRPRISRSRSRFQPACCGLPVHYAVAPIEFTDGVQITNKLMASGKGSSYFCLKVLPGDCEFGLDSAARIARAGEHTLVSQPELAGIKCSDPAFITASHLVFLHWEKLIPGSTRSYRSRSSVVHRWSKSSFSTSGNY